MGWERNWGIKGEGEPAELSTTGEVALSGLARPKEGEARRDGVTHYSYGEAR